MTETHTYIHIRSTINSSTASFKNDDGLRWYYFDGFDILIRTEMIEKMEYLLIFTKYNRSALKRLVNFLKYNKNVLR